MNLRTLIVLVVIGVACAWLISGALELRRSISFFEKSLSDAAVFETVIVGGKTYTVAGGTISNPPSARVHAEILATAYALTLARRAPLLGLAGAKTEELSRAADDLAPTLESLARAQETPEEVDAVKALYPAGFLKELSTLEASRRTFIDSGSDTDAAAYHRRLRATIDAYAQDLTRFVGHFEKHAGDDVRFAGLAGVTSTEQMRMVLAQLIDGMETLRRAYDARMRCFEGSISACNALEIALPRVLATQTEEPPLPAITSSIERLRGEHVGTNVDLPHEYVFLLSNTCVARDTPPMLVRVETGASDPRLPRVRYMEDVFFLETATANGPTMRYVHDTLGIRYSYMTPFNFYLCPEAARPIGIAQAVTRIADFARKHPDLAHDSRAPLLDGPLSEGAARAYLMSALEETATNTDARMNEVLELVLSLRGGSGVEIVARSIADVMRVHALKKASGIPFDLSARYLYLTHSAFPSLFLSFDPVSGAVSSLYGDSPDDLDEFMQHIVRYSDLRKTVSDEAIARDMYEFIKFEERID